LRKSRRATAAADKLLRDIGFSPSGAAGKVEIV
jgi:hypothetical protein